MATTSFRAARGGGKSRRKQVLEIRVSGGYQSGQMGQTVNLLSFDFGGSNPSLPTNFSKAIKIAEVAQLIEH